MSRWASWPFVVLVGLISGALPAGAEDVRGRWSFSLGVGMISTLDDIRNNASVLRLQDPGKQFPDDISDDIVVIGSNDRRQDDLLGRETAVEERQIYNLSVGYGLTSWLSLQVDVGMSWRKPRIQRRLRCSISIE